MKLTIEAVPDPRGSVRDYVYETLKRSIMEFELEPGRLISENEVSETLQASRSPIREAFMKLSQEGLIETIPQRGSIISLIDLDLVEESRFVRERIETAAVRRACGMLKPEQRLQLNYLLSLQELCVAEKNNRRLFELDGEFHRTILAGCGLNRTMSLLQQLDSHYHRIRILRLAENFDWQIILTEHRAIAQAIGDKDPNAAERAMHAHLNHVNDEAEELRKKFPAYFR